MSTRTVDNPKVVSREEWLVARRKLLAREKQLTRERDAIAAERRQLPWVKVEKNYVFDSPSGKQTLADLFDGKSQLIVYHLMFGPEWKEACPSCSFNMDHTDGALVHLAQRDVSFAAISRAAYPKIAAFKKRMGWRFNWVSSNANEFNDDYHVVFTKEELATGKVDHNFNLEAFPGTDAPGISVFFKDQNGEIFHTYSAYARGTETTMTCPKAAMRMAWPSRCPGSAIMIATTPATWQTQPFRTGLRTPSLRAEARPLETEQTQ
jgi:predicted dithiol-disulfide oxidoreductase (DUF899 family)